jgi:hypothetical protein
MLSVTTSRRSVAPRRLPYDLFAGKVVKGCSERGNRRELADLVPSGCHRVRTISAASSNSSGDTQPTAEKVGAPPFSLQEERHAARENLHQTLRLLHQPHGRYLCLKNSATAATRNPDSPHRVERHLRAASFLSASCAPREKSA